MLDILNLLLNKLINVCKNAEFDFLKCFCNWDNKVIFI